MIGYAKGRGIMRTVMVLVVMGILAVAGCRKERAQQAYVSLEELLEKCDRYELIEAEQALELGEPVDVRRPSLTDPMWWFVYLKDGRRVELGANAANIAVGQEISDRKGFCYTGYYWVGSAECRGGHRAGADGRASLTLDMLHGRGDYDNRYAKYLQAVDMTKQITIAQMEAEMGLSQPHVEGPPCGVEPMWWFAYEKDSHAIVLMGNGVGGIGDCEGVAQHTDKFIFTVYWRVEEISPGQK